MISSSTPFYVTGGTLRGDAASYVRRKADESLFASLAAGEFCYVLDARQMGKSSLMIRTAARLEAAGITVFKLDLTAVGLDLSSEQWYFGLLEGLSCRLEVELERFWETHRQLGPLQRWFTAIEEVLLPRTQGRVVIFIDEIDIVRSLPFRTDEFFAGIRECYNRRASVTELDRLAFCLLGVTTPSELIQDVIMTPFNIGTRIELSDFTSSEADILGYGLSDAGRDGGALLQRVLYWTGGHPYLTQQLCRTVAETEDARTEHDVDRMCSELYLSPRAKKQDNNLLFVRARLLQGGADVAGLLDLYAQVHANKRIADDDSNPLIDHLRLSGIVRVLSGCLQVRNRIYFLVFDRDWVRTNMPDAEVRRQRTAFRRGVQRTLAISSAILAMMSLLVVVAFNQTGRANKLAAEARRQTAIADRNLYFANINLVQRDWENSNVAHARELLELTRTYPGRGFEWGYWNRLCHMDLATWPKTGPPAICSPDGCYFFTNDESQEHGTGIIWDAKACRIVRYLEGNRVTILSAAFSPDSRFLATGGEKNTAKIWIVANGKLLRTLNGPSSAVCAVAFSPDGLHIVTGCFDATAKIWDVKTGHEILSFKGHTKPILSVGYSPTGTRVVTSGGQWDLDAPGEIKVWDTKSGRETLRLIGHRNTIRSVAFSPDGRRILSGSDDATARVWDAKTGRSELTLKGHARWIRSASFSPDGKRIVTGSDDNTAIVWDSRTGAKTLTLKGHAGRIGSVAFSADGKRILTGSQEGTVMLWNAESFQEAATCAGHGGAVLSVAFSPDGQHILTGSVDHTAILWNARTYEKTLTLKDHTGPIRSVAFSPDGTRILTGSDDGNAIDWDTKTGRRILVLHGHTKPVCSVAFSFDGLRILTGSHDGTARVWDAYTGREALTLRGHFTHIYAVAFSPDGRRVLIGGGEENPSDFGGAEIWDAQRGIQCLTLKGHTCSVSSVAFAADGRHVLTGESVDEMAKVWDAATGLNTLTLRGHKNAITSVAFSPDGQRILTGCCDSTAKLWDSGTGREVLTLKGHGNSVLSACFSPDAKRILTGSYDKTAIVWTSDAEAGNR